MSSSCRQYWLRVFWALGCCSSVLFVATAAPRQMLAEPLDYTFGTVSNYNYNNLGGFCVGASFINGAVYLQNAFPTVYGGTKISTGTASTTAAAALNFSYNGWTSSSGASYSGYYTRVSSDGNNFGDWWQTMIDWTETYAPNRTAYSGQVGAALMNYLGEDSSTWTLSSNVAEEFPSYSFLNAAAVNNKYVELCIYGYYISQGYIYLNGGHAINLADITYSNGAYKLHYQDPNYASTQFLSATLNTMTINGEQAFTFYDGYTFESNVFIAAAFTEVPTPEPCQLIMLFGAMAMWFVWRRRRNVTIK